MEKLEKSTLNFFEVQNIKVIGKKFLLACSGGKDSMILAHVLYKLKIPFAIAHCNFQLRGEDSENDQKFLEEYCLKNDIPFYFEKFQTKIKAQELGKSIQMMARELRYSFFREICAKHSFDFTLTAHHLDDSLETQIINLSRGTGLNGLQGIPPINNKTLRPLHLCTRGEMDDYQKSQNLKWREDCSNASDNYQRNFIRHHISPLLKKSSPNFEKGYLQSVEYIQQDLELYNFMLEKIKNEICLEQKTGLDLDLGKLDSYPSTSSILKYILQPFGFTDLLAIEKSFTSTTGKEFESDNYRALINRGVLEIRKKENPTNQSYFIKEQDQKILIPLRFQIETVSPQEINLGKLATHNAALDFEKLRFPLEFRKWKEGDRFRPLGMNHTKKLSDFFIDEKVSKFEKLSLWLLCSGGDIVWIIGHRINDLYKITEQTKRAYYIKLLK